MLFQTLQSSSLISNFILIIGFVVIGLGVLLILTLVLSRKKQNEMFLDQQRMAAKFQSQLLQSQIEVQEATFKHIARELHDNVGQLLSTTKMLLGVTEINLATPPDTLLTASATLGKAIQELRLVSRTLDHEWLEQFNFLENIQEEVQRINAGGIVAAHVDCKTSIEMPPDEQIILYRIVQEAVQNAVRHAQPSVLDILIKSSEDELYVEVSNDGAPLREDFSGMGTNNMRKRAQLFGGEVTWHTEQQKTYVRIVLPLKKHHENQNRFGR